MDAAIAAAEDWTTREPSRADAWFYLGAAYGARVQWRVLRVERLAAARDGKRIKESLDRALALDPQMEDARFGLGLYQYLRRHRASDREVPSLSAVPSWRQSAGRPERHDRARRSTVRSAGRSRVSAALDLFLVRTTAAAGTRLLRHLQNEYPRNPLFPQRIAEVQVEYFHDPSASLAAWQALADAAEAGTVGEAAAALARARLGAAEQLDALYRLIAH